MVAKDSSFLKKPDTQDLADFVIDQLPDSTEDQRKVKEAFYLLTKKLKEILDYYENTITELQT